jgi:hypothetical protein
LARGVRALRLNRRWAQQLSEASTLLRCERWGGVYHPLDVIALVIGRHG